MYVNGIDVKAEGAGGGGGVVLVDFMWKDT